MSWLDWVRPRPRAGAVAQAAFRPGRGRLALVAAAAPVTPDEGKRQQRARRPWQRAAFDYRRALPEVGYVMRFLGNNSAHIRLFAADQPTDDPDSTVELDDDYDGDLPADLIAAAQEAMRRLTGSAPSGGGAAILAPLVQHYELVGECWLVGRYDPDANGGQGQETWAIHSISEVKFMDGRFPAMNPASPPGYYRLQTGWGRNAEAEDLDPATTTVVRMWTADPEWSAEPDSPMRSLEGVCEQLLLVEKATNAALRSRAAGNGILLMPDEMTFGDDGDDPDESDDEFQRDLTTQLTTPLIQDGSAAQVAPMMVRGPYQYLDRIRQLTLERPLAPELADREQRLLARLGIGLDVPPEVITGLADTNHWNAWQITSDLFKQHQEPITIVGCEGLTLGYLRLRLRTMQQWDDALIDRIVVGYDPGGLIAEPDMKQAANDAHAAGAISDRAYRRLLHLDESDAPEAAEEELVGSTGLPLGRLQQVAGVATSLLRWGFKPDAVAQALGLGIEHTGMIPMTFRSEDALEEAGVPPIMGDTPGGENKPPALPPGSEPTPPAPPPAEPPAPPAEPGQAASLALSRLLGRPIHIPAERLALTASAPQPAAPTARQRRLSRRLMDIDRRLRERINAAADAAMHRALERAGNRVRGGAQGNEQARVAASGQPAERVASALGRSLVAALGMSDDDLLADAFARLRTQYLDWTGTAAEEAIDAACQITGLDRTDPEVRRVVAELRDAFAAAADTSWPSLESELEALAGEYLYQPDPTLPEAGELPDSLVPPGLIRSALAIAGGLPGDHSGLAPLSALTSGELLQRFMRQAGSQVAEYEWSYGISSRPFPPHQQLDGLVFSDFNDPALSTAAFPGYEWVGGSFAPGDHKGCHCDPVVIWAGGASAADEAEMIGQRAYAEQNPGRELPTRRATVDGFADTGTDPRLAPSGGGTAQFARTTATK